MSVQAISWVLDHSASSYGERLVLISIANHATKTGCDAWPTVATIADEAGVDETTVKRAIRWALESGELIVRARIGFPERPVNRRTNAYCFPLMKQCGHDVGGHIAPPETELGGASGSCLGGHPEAFGGASGLAQLSELTVLEPSVEPSTNTRDAVLDLRIVSASAEAAPGFDDFWNVYPRKVGKPSARRAWAKAIKRAEAATIVAGASRWRDDPGRDDLYTAHPSTWLNDDRWEDQPLPSRNGASSRLARSNGQLAEGLAQIQRLSQGGTGDERRGAVGARRVVPPLAPPRPVP